MPLLGYVGHAQALDAREAGSLAARKALEQLGRNPTSLGIVIASHTVSLQQAANGATAQLGDVPLWGFSTIGELTTAGYQQHSVSVAVLSSTEMTARVDWWSGFSENSPLTAKKMLQALHLQQPGTSLLLAVDGLGGEIKDLLKALPQEAYALAGCLAGGDLRLGRSYQLGGRHSGSGGVASAVISGKLRMSTGIAHGWQPVGLHYEITSASKQSLQTLNGEPASEVLSRTFGFPPSEWLIPPLKDLVRLYPLGVEQEAGQPLLLRSALQVNQDGSLRTHTTLPEGRNAHLMIGSASNCLQAAEQAAAQALQGLNGARPVLGLVLVDTAWRSLLETRAGDEIQAVQRVLGSQIPLAGGYVYGQIARSGLPEPGKGAPELFNQSLEVILFGEVE